MIPVPFLVPTVGVTAGAQAGVIDNVAETREADGSVDRRGAVFEGVSGTLNLRYETPRGSTYSLYANGRGLYLTRFDGQGSDLTGAASANGIGRIMLGRSTALDVHAASSISQATSARAGDGLTLGQRVDPLIQGTTFTTSDASLGLYQELGRFYRLQVSVDVAATAVLAAPAIELGDGLSLDRTGLDGLTITGRASVMRELSDRSLGDVAITYRRQSAPYSINSFSIPPRIGGPIDNDQIAADAGYTRTLTEHWNSLTRAGVSFTTPSPYDPDQRIDTFPVASQSFVYVDERTFANIGANLSYSALVPRLGTGPLFAATATLAGQPFYMNAFKNTVIALASTLNYSTTSGAAADGSATLETFSFFGVGATAEVRHPLTRAVALHLGYDFFGVRSSTSAPNTEANVSIRNTVFAGLSLYWANDGNVVPMNNRALPE